MLQMASNDIEDVILVNEAITESSFVSDSSDHQVLSFGDSAREHISHVFEQRASYEADEEHLVHVDLRILLINIFKALTL